MIAVVTILGAFALGYLMSSRLAANTTYAVAYLWAFTYQTLYLILDSFGGTSANPAFEPSELPAVLRPGHAGDLRRRLRSGRGRAPLPHPTPGRPGKAAGDASSRLSQRGICWLESRSPPTRPRRRSPAWTRVVSRSSRSRATWLERSW